MISPLKYLSCSIFCEEDAVGHEGERYICLDNGSHSTDAIFAKLNSLRKPNDLVTMQQHHVSCNELGRSRALAILTATTPISFEP